MKTECPELHQPKRASVSRIWQNKKSKGCTQLNVTPSLLQKCLWWKAEANAGFLACDIFLNGWVCVNDQALQTPASKFSAIKHISFCFPAQEGSVKS